MICNFCGNNNVPNNVSNCPYCGNLLNNTYMNPGMNNYYNGQSYMPKPNFGIFIAISVLEMLLLSRLLGILALVSTLSASSAYKRGDYLSVQKNMKSAKTELIVGVILGIIGFVISFIINYLD